MQGGSRIVAIESGSPLVESGDEFLLTQEMINPSPDAPLADAAIDHDEASGPPTTARGQRVAALGALVALIAWTGFFIWARQGELLSGPGAATATRLIADWAMPVLLLAVAWLVAMRSSRRETLRFADAAQALSLESGRLEARLLTVNRELSLARDFIAAQSRDLESLGRIASERLTRNAEQLQQLIAGNGERIDAIGDVSLAALDNMEKLRGQLPVLANSAKDVTNNIANAGRTAHAHIEKMIAGFNRINEFGHASENQVAILQQGVDLALSALAARGREIESIAESSLSDIANRSAELAASLERQQEAAFDAIRARAATLRQEAEQVGQQLDSHEAENLTSLRARMNALRDEGSVISRAMRDREARALEAARHSLSRIAEEAARFDEALVGRADALAGRLTSLREAAETQDRAALAGLEQRLRNFDELLVERRTTHGVALDVIAAQTDALSGRLDQFGARTAEISGHVGQAEAEIAARLATLSRDLTDSRNTLAGADGMLAGLTDASVRLLELIQASAQQGREDLPRALAAGEQTLAQMETRATALAATLDDAGAQGERLTARIDSSRAGIEALATQLIEAQRELDALDANHKTVLIALDQSLDAAEQRGNRIAQSARGELSDAITALDGAAQDAVARLGQNGARTVATLANDLGRQSAEAIDKAMRDSAAQSAGQLEAAASRAAATGREAALALRDQLAKVSELTGHLEKRVAHARERAEEQVDNDFARRAALVTEALNSNAIDITRVLSSDVADTAWAAYLRGDRGVFTRRAVRLLDSGEARSVAQLYEADADFREHVSRYVHDFEAILRQVLSARDGQALGVTLLSSDMGKLYVALAQGIERLRD